jgi:hypothetical protein
MTYFPPHHDPRHHPFDAVEVLLPLRIHHARQRLAGMLRADLSALIETLPAAPPFPAAGDWDQVDPAQFKTWALAVISALPVHRAGTTGDTSWE